MQTMRQGELKMLREQVCKPLGDRCPRLKAVQVVESGF